MQNVAGKMIKGSLWISGARAVSNMLSFVGTIVLARILVPADFGLVALGTTMLAIVNAVTDISLTQALVHHRDPTDHHFNTAWTLNSLRGMAIGVAMAAAAIPMARVYAEPRLSNVIYALAFATFVSGMTNPRRVMLTKQLVFWQDFLLTVSQRVVTVSVSVAIAIIYKSYWALIAGVIAGQIAADLISYTALPYRPRPTLRHARELWSFSVWISLGQAINTINWKFDQMMVGIILNKSALGFYSVGENLAQIPSREATQPLTKTMFPAFSQIVDDPNRLKKAYQRAQALVTAIVLPVGGGVTLIASPLVELSMGTKWLPAVPVIEAFSAFFALSTLGTLVQPLALAKGHTKTLFRRDVVMFLIQLPLVVGGMYFGGLPGLIYGRVAASIVAISANMILVRRFLEISILAQFWSNRRSLFAFIAMMTIVSLAKTVWLSQISLFMQLISISMLGAIAYIGITLLLWIAEGRKDGPENEAGRLLSGFLARLRPPKSADVAIGDAP